MNAARSISPAAKRSRAFHTTVPEPMRLPSAQALIIGPTDKAIAGDYVTTIRASARGESASTTFRVTVTTSTVVLALAVFGASAVEMVEALTIVAAAGVSRGWRSALVQHEIPCMKRFLPSKWDRA